MSEIFVPKIIKIC